MNLIIAAVIGVTLASAVILLGGRLFESKEAKFLRRAYKALRRKHRPKWEYRHDHPYLTIRGPEHSVTIGFVFDDPRAFTWNWQGHRKEPPSIDNVEYGLVIKIRDLVEELEPRKEPVIV